LTISYLQIDIFSDLIALDLGIVHPTIALAARQDRPKSIDEALSSMTSKESRRTRRKFRKLVRNIHKQKLNKTSIRRRRVDVMLAIRRQAWSMVKSHSADSGDNDEI
jgi:hypothetical protein